MNRTLCSFAGCTAAIRMSALALLAVMLAAPSSGQSCNEIPVTINVGDGSTPDPVANGGFLVMKDCSSELSWLADAPFGTSHTFVGGLECMEILRWTGDNVYIAGPPGANVTCSDGCCDGQYSHEAYSAFGSITATVTPVPSRRSGSYDAFVAWAGPGDAAAGDCGGAPHYWKTPEPDGTIVWDDSTTSNNWGLNFPGVSGPGEASYHFWVGAGTCASAESVLLHSNEMKFVSLELPSEDVDEEPAEQRPCDACTTTLCPRSPPSAPGAPVTVLNGNVWFDQSDATVPVLGGALAFTRSYNSLGAYHGRAGIFGRGWTHAYEQAIDEPELGVARLRLATGQPYYFEDSDDDQTFVASIPLTEQSTLVKSAGGWTRTFRSGGAESYDTSGLLVSRTDSAGRTTSLGRDASGRLTSISRGGQTLHLEYDASGHLISLSHATGLLASYTYDASDRLATVTYPDTSGYSFVYDSLGQILRVLDHSGRVVESHEYDAGRGVTSEITDGVEKLTFDYGDHSTTVTDAAGNATIYEWQFIQGMKRVTRITGPCSGCGGGGGSETQEWAYDAAGRIVAYTDGAGEVTQYEYDANGDLVKEIDPLLQETVVTYDAQGRTLTRSGPDGSVVTYTHGAAGPLTITEKVTSTTDRTTTLTYGTAGLLETITDPRSKTTTLAYDVLGQLESVTDPLSGTTQFTYDELGRRTHVADPLDKITETTYDSRGRVVKVENADATATVFSYDKAGRRTSVTDPLNRQTRYVYDDYGRLEAVVDPSSQVTRYAYDVRSNLVLLRDAAGNETSFAYDAAGRVETVTHPGGAQETYTYDTRGLLASRTDRRGVVTTYTYDALGRLTGKGYSDTTPAVSYSYDAGGRLSTAANGSDTLTWTYDLAGQLTSEQSSYNASTVAYAYDDAGNRLSVSLDGTLFVSYGYDDASRLVSITRGADVFGFAYDIASRRTAMTYPNGVVTTYSYDDVSRLTSLAANLGATPITSFGYAYDDAGNRIQKTTLDHTEDYVYDALYRLEEANRSGTGANRWQYGYDTVGNRTTHQVGESEVMSSTYNEKNQLLARDVGGRLRIRGSLDEPGTVTVNAAPARMLPGNAFETDVEAVPGLNTFTIEATDVSGNPTTQSYQVTVTGSTASYSYDPNGNLTQKTDNGHVWDYVWNAENQLIRVCKDLTPPQTCDSDGVAVASFKYDPMERRIEKVAGGTTYSYTYDKEDIAREVRSDGTTRRYVHGPSIDEPLAWENGWGARTYYHADGLGSVVRHTDGDGLVVLDRRYDAWGNLESGQQEPGHAFTGREWDSEASAFYYRARYYDPSIGRFLSEDPIGFSGGLNFYAYVNGRPTTLADPTGLQASCCAVIEGRKKELHCILDAIEKGRPQEECFGGREPRVGGYLTCAGHTPDPIDVDHIRRTNPPCLVQCSIAHEERHAQQCRRHGVDYLAYHSDAAERAAYMVELGCLIKQEREEGCCS